MEEMKMNQTELDKKTRRREQVKMAQRRHMAKKKAMLEKVPETNDDETESESEEESVVDMKTQKAVVPMKKTASQIEEENGVDASPNMDDEPKKDNSLHNLVKRVHMDLKLLKSEFSDLMKKLQDPVSDDTDEEPEQFPEPPKEQSAPKSMAVFV